MTTRTIVTSQPDVACAVCERRLLRGEQPDFFLAAGRRRIVCELCAPRAAHEGWLRESDSESATAPALRPRRGRSLFERLRQVGKPASRAAVAQAPSPTAQREQELYERAAGERGDPELQADAGREAYPALATVQPRDAASLVEPESETRREPGETPPYVEQAVAVFNASEFPRRVAGVARALGAPAVNVRSAEHLSSVVSIVVAWELCWYRYEVDLSEPVAEAQVIAEGTEVAELAREDRRANAAVSESGTLTLASV